ncbi:MAG: hypothetical protein PWP62_2292 [Eubacteriaceae bacterium]|nr:hypothetical protein [Eubacteriaceae bacterium]
MRTKKFFYNTLSTALLQIIVMIAGFITPRIMLEYYGSEINGLVASISQFISYFNLVEAGLSGAAVYALYKPLADNDHERINSVVAAARKFYIHAGYIFLSLTIGLAVFYPIFIEEGALSTISIGLLTLILGVNGVLEFFTLAKYRVLLTADQKAYVISIASLVGIIINTGIIIVLGRLQVDIVLLRFIALLSIFVRSIILMVYTKLHYKYLDFKVKHDEMALNKRWDVLYLQILGVVQQGAPVIILTIIVKDLMLVSVFSIYNMIMIGINGILSIFISGLSASFGDVIIKKETDVLKKAYSEFEYIYYALITAVYATAFIMIMPFIRIYTNGITDIVYYLPLVGFLFVLNGLLYNIKTPQGMLVISAGLFKETRIQTTIQGLIVVLGGILLAPFTGIVGVMIASIISNLYRDIDLLFFIPRKVTKLKITHSLWRILRMIGSLVIIFLISQQCLEITPNNYFEWFIDSLVVGIISLVTVIIINLICERNAMQQVYWRLLRMVKK